MLTYFKLKSSLAMQVQESLAGNNWQIFVADISKVSDAISYFEIGVNCLPMAPGVSRHLVDDWSFPSNWSAFDDFLREGIHSVNNCLAILLLGADTVQLLHSDLFVDIVEGITTIFNDQRSSPSSILILFGEEDDYMAEVPVKLTHQFSIPCETRTV